MSMRLERVRAPCTSRGGPRCRPRSTPGPSRASARTGTRRPSTWTATSPAPAAVASRYQRALGAVDRPDVDRPVVLRDPDDRAVLGPGRRARLDLDLLRRGQRGEVRFLERHVRTLIQVARRLDGGSVAGRGSNRRPARRGYPRRRGRALRTRRGPDRRRRPERLRRPGRLAVRAARGRDPADGQLGGANRHGGRRLRGLHAGLASRVDPALRRRTAASGRSTASAGPWGAELPPGPERRRADREEGLERRGRLLRLHDEATRRPARRSPRSSRACSASAGIEQVVVVGLATDYCVSATALDAIKLGFETEVLQDAIAVGRPAARATASARRRAMLAAGCVLGYCFGTLPVAGACASTSSTRPTSCSAPTTRRARRRSASTA